MRNIISNKIRELRMEHGFRSAESLSRALAVSLKTVQGWENDSKEPNITLRNLLKMCELFNCDLDYLVGRIDESTHDIKTACEVTGLSETAVKRLKGKTMGKTLPVNALSHLIESPGFIEFLTSYNSFLDLLGKMKHTDPKYGMWTTYRLRADGKVVMDSDDAVHHYMSKASSALTYICEDDYNRRIKEGKIRPKQYDYEELIAEIKATEEEIEYLQGEKEYLETEILPSFAPDDSNQEKE